MKKHNLFVRLALVSIAAFGVSAFSQTQANAASTTTTPGNLCQGQLSRSRPTGVAIEANLGSDLIYCGLPRTNPTGTVTSAFARVNNPSGGTSTCYFYAFDSLGATFDWDSATTSTAGSQSLSFDAVNISTYGYGYYYTFCNVPQNAKIWGIRFSES